MPFSRTFRYWIGAGTCLVAVLAVACLSLPARGLARIAISDVITALIMFSALASFAVNARSSSGRSRWFWILQAAGWALWLADQGFWIAYDLFLHTPMPSMHVADILLFTAEVPMLAGLLLRPHLQPSQRTARLGILDFLLLLVWWVYLYVFFITSWQYVHPDLPSYNLNYDWLFGTETLVLIAVSSVLWRQSSGKWKRFYGAYVLATILNSLTFFTLNYAIELNKYFTGSWYDVPYAASMTIFSVVALSGSGLTPFAESQKDEAYTSSMASVAMLAVLSLPVMAGFALYNQTNPREVCHFRISVTLATMFLMALLNFLKHYRLNQELHVSNMVLEEASLTDPLTGVRNRRYFSATISSDVSQALRAHADGHDSRARDLIFYLIDADNFKEINDRYGHDAGDLVLKEMTRRIRSSIRHSDVLVRWGGEEFLIVSRYTDRREAETLAGRVLSAVASTPFTLEHSGDSVYRTCSIGWAPFPWKTSDPGAIHYEEVLSLADRALNQAKRAGRNRSIGLVPGKDPIPEHRKGRFPVDHYSVDAFTTVGPAQLQQS